MNHVAETAPIGLSDHCTVDFVLNVKCCLDIKNHKADNEKMYKWFDTDFEGFGRYLNSVNLNDFICYNPSAESGWLDREESSNVQQFYLGLCSANLLFHFSASSLSTCSLIICKRNKVKKSKEEEEEEEEENF